MCSDAGFTSSLSNTSDLGQLTLQLAMPNEEAVRAWCEQGDHKPKTRVGIRTEAQASMCAYTYISACKITNKHICVYVDIYDMYIKVCVCSCAHAHAHVHIRKFMCENASGGPQFGAFLLMINRLYTRGSLRGGGPRDLL